MQAKPQEVHDLPKAVAMVAWERRPRTRGDRCPVHGEPNRTSEGDRRRPRFLGTTSSSARAIPMEVVRLPIALSPMRIAYVNSSRTAVEAVVSAYRAPPGGGWVAFGHERASV